MAGETTLDQVMGGSMAHSDSLQQRLVIVVVDLLVIFDKEIPQRGRRPHFNCQLENMSFITYRGGAFFLFSFQLHNQCCFLEITTATFLRVCYACERNQRHLTTFMTFGIFLSLCFSLCFSLSLHLCLSQGNGFHGHGNFDFPHGNPSGGGGAGTGGGVGGW